MTGHRHRDSGGAVGFELLPFLVLVFVVGALMIAQAWSVLDAKLATNSAAREATRTFVEHQAGAEAAALASALDAGAAAARAHNPARDTAVSLVEGALVRCERVTFEAEQSIDLLRVPLLGGAGTMTVRSTHSEIVDPFRDGLDGEASCAT